MFEFPTFAVCIFLATQIVVVQLDNSTTVSKITAIPFSNLTYYVLGNYSSTDAGDWKSFLVWSKVFSEWNQSKQFQPLTEASWNFIDISAAQNQDDSDDKAIGTFINSNLSNQFIAAYFGPPKSCFYETRIASTDNNLIFPMACNDNRSIGLPVRDFTTTIDVEPSDSDYAYSLLAIFRNFNWTSVVLLFPGAENAIYNSTIARYLAITSGLRSGGITFTEFQYRSDPVTLDQLFNFSNPNATGQLTNSNHSLPYIIWQTYLQTRIYVFFAVSRGANQLFIQLLENMGLLQTGEYFVLVIYPGMEVDRYYTIDDPSKASFAEFLYSNCSERRNYSAALCYRSASQALQGSRAYAGIIRTPSSSSSKFTEIQAYARNLTSLTCLPNCSAVQSYNITMPSFKTSEEDIRAYDALMVYASTAVAMASQGLDITDGGSVAQMIRNKVYKSAGGYSYYIDYDGTNYGNLSVIYSSIGSQNGSQYRSRGLWPIANFWYRNASIDLSLLFHMLNSNELNFNWILGKPAKGVPDCGFSGSICIRVQSDLWKYLTIGGVLITVVFGTAAAFILKAYMYERALQTSFWKVDGADLVIQKGLAESLRSLHSGGGSMMAGRSMGSLASVASAQSMDVVRSQRALQDYEKDILKQARKKARKSQKNNRSTSKRNVSRKLSRGSKQNIKRDSPLDEVTDFGVALYHNNFVGLKRVYKGNVDLSRVIRRELKLMTDLKHDHLVHFIGMVLEPPNVLVVTEYCTKHSLKDILENDKIQLDLIFISSMVFDIIKGMTFIHESLFGVHGRLKSSNCLIDSRWVIKVSGHGLYDLRHNERNLDLDEDSRARELLWTAPELLRYPEAPKGTKAGDVYSFGILLHEIFGRNGTFGGDVTNPTEAIQQLRRPVGRELLRPALSHVESAPSYVVKTMEKCWSEQPEQRPTFKEAGKALKPLTKGLKSNVFDNMLMMMLKYTKDLEEVVEERTTLLQQEKKRSEKLLLQMLPRPIAEQLKMGKLVDPEAYESATLYFSDMVGFQKMVDESTPIQVIAFLNDIYSFLDAIIERYDVYKVETIGDSYMVVSGLPIRNGHNHAGEIASMSLQLMNAIKTFKIAHRPEDIVQLRIGINSGPCVAGVVGLKMPRYCLFGDAINTASRMESNGEALKIHCSGSCKELLDILGGYSTSVRGTVYMKGKGEQVTYWLVDENVQHAMNRIASESVKYPYLKKTRFQQAA